MENSKNKNALPGSELEVLHFPFDTKILSSLIHSVPFSVYAKDKNGVFIFANLKYCQSVGKPLNQILGKTDYEIHPGELAEKYLADDRMIMSSRKTRIIEESWQSIGGQTHYVQVAKTPLVDNEDPDRVIGTLGVFWNITDRKRAEVQVEEERNFLRTLIEIIPALIYVKDTEGKFLIANKAIAEFMKAGTPEELIGKTDFDYYTRDVAQSFADIEKTVFTTGKQANDLIESFTYKGKKFWINTSKKPFRNLEGEIVGLVGVGHDITHIKLIEEKLRESEERYAAVVNQALEGIYLLDPNSKKVLDSNISFRNMIGFSEEELADLRVYDFVIHEHQEIDNIIKNVIDSNDFAIGERCYRHKKGYILNVEVSATLINFGGKQAMLVIVRDVSEKKAAEEEKERLKEKLRQAQKFEALGTLAGGVAHDLNNILSGIVSYPELLMNKLPEESELRKPLSVIHDSGIRASTIVADLLTIARSAASNKQVCNLNIIVKEFMESPEFREIKSQNKAVHFQYELSNEQANIFCSPVHIKKCLMNLVINASEAVGSNGGVFIRVIDNRLQDTQPEKESDHEDRPIILQVADNGPGISANDLGRIFEPFYTKKEMGRSGTGLGLTVVWNTVNDHGGSITVDSDTTGTSFNLRFPFSNQIIQEENRASNDHYMAEKNEHILIVDDEQVLRDIASEMLGQLGYRVDAVSSGEAAVEYVKNKKTDLLLIDMLMEPGINGRETFQKIQRIHPAIKALIVSGYSEDEDVQETLRAGARGFVQKPYLMSRLGQAVKDALLKR